MSHRPASHLAAAQLALDEAEARSDRPISPLLRDTIEGVARAWDGAEAALDVPAYVVPTLAREMRQLAVLLDEVSRPTDTDSEFDAISAEMSRRGM